MHGSSREESFIFFTQQPLIKKEAAALRVLTKAQIVTANSKKAPLGVEEKKEK